MNIDIKVEDIFHNKNIMLIDVRSPGEYEDSTIPGAINIPLFNDEERAEVGTIYKQISSDAARKRGIEIVSPKIPSIISNIEILLKSGQVPVIFCARGGLRSKSVATFLEFANIPVKRLDGGYRAYREKVQAHLLEESLNCPVIVLHGLTGVGKTDILEHLKGDYAVIDLEYMAGHRGSAFGSIGMKPRSQKMFENLLHSRLIEIRTQFEHPVVILEAESKRIGKVQLPSFIMEAKQNGYHIEIVASLQTRVNRLVNLYTHHGHDRNELIQEISVALKPIEKRMKPNTKETIKDALNRADFATIALSLIEEYYDSRYAHKMLQYDGTFTQIKADNIGQAVEELKDYISQFRPVEMK